MQNFPRKSPWRAKVSPQYLAQHKHFKAVERLGLRFLQEIVPEVSLSTGWSNEQVIGRVITLSTEGFGATPAENAGWTFRLYQGLLHHRTYMLGVVYGYLHAQVPDWRARIRQVIVPESSPYQMLMQIKATAAPDLVDGCMTLLYLTGKTPDEATEDDYATLAALVKKHTNPQQHGLIDFWTRSNHPALLCSVRYVLQRIAQKANGDLALLARELGLS